jgi:hypothetical protein
LTADGIRMQRDTTVTDWTKEIDDFLADDARSRRQVAAGQEAQRAHAAAFITGTVLPAFQQLKANLEQPGRDRRVDIQHISGTRVQLTIAGPASTPAGRGGTLAELDYTFELAIDPTTAHAVKIIDDGDGPTPELLASGMIDYLNQALIINDVLRHWQEAVRKQGATR